MGCSLVVPGKDNHLLLDVAKCLERRPVGLEVIEIGDHRDIEIGMPMKLTGDLLFQLPLGGMMALSQGNENRETHGWLSGTGVQNRKGLSRVAP